MREHRREYDLKVIGKNFQLMRQSRNLSVNDIREYLCLGSLQAIYKYESGKGLPQADALLALMELFDATYHDIIDVHDDVSSFSFMGETDKIQENDSADEVDYIVKSNVIELFVSVSKCCNIQMINIKKRLLKYYNCLVQNQNNTR